MTKELLPLGTVVYLEEGTKKILIVGRGLVIEDTDTGKDVYFDYIGCFYPEGIDPEDAIFFNKENIDEVIFTGYYDEEERRFVKIYNEWETESSIKKKIIT